MKITYKKVNIGYPCYSVFVDGLFIGCVMKGSRWFFEDLKGCALGWGKTRDEAVKDYLWYLENYERYC